MFIGDGESDQILRPIDYFDTDCLKEGWNGSLFTIHDNKQILFKDGTSGSFDYDGMWEVMDKHNLIVNIQ